MTVVVPFQEDLLSWKATFFIRENITDMTNKLDLTKTVFALAGTVRVVCGETEKENK